MFQAVLRRAQLAVDQTIERFVSSAIVALPFVIGFGFGTVALTFRLIRQFGPEMGNAVMGGLFLVLGLIVLATTSVRTPHVAHPAGAEAELAPTSVETTAAPVEEPITGDPADRELVMAALSTMAPVALPRLLQMVLSNLPVLAVLAAALFVVFQKNDGGEDIGAPGQPV